MKKISLLIISACISISLFAQTKAEQQAIKSLCGCYEVDFKYAETFAADKNYKIPAVYHTGGLEWVVAEEAGDKKFVLQHLLVIDDSTVIKHWREDWEFEKSDWLQFTHDGTWKHVAGNKLNTKGQWTQTVWEVDDAPRYQGSSNWVTSNNKYYWENTTDAPLPRREYTKRSDYNVMQRTNRIILTDTGWVHEQDNKKIVRNDGTVDKFVAEEKGYNIYRKTDESKCKQAAAWWQQHKPFWSTVRQTWEEAMKDKSNVHLISKVNGQLLYEQLDDLGKENLTDAQLKQKVKELVNGHIDNGNTKDAATKGSTY